MIDLNELLKEKNVRNAIENIKGNLQLADFYDYTEAKEEFNDEFFKNLKKKIENKIKENKKIFIIVFQKGDAFKIPDWFIDWIKSLRKKGILVVIKLKDNNIFQIINKIEKINGGKNNCCIDTNLFFIIDNDFRNYLFNNQNYVRNLNYLRNIFNTNFMNTSPIYFTGNTCNKGKDKYVLISLNPGAKKPNYSIEDIIMNISYVLYGNYNPIDWLNFYIHFYELFFINGLTSNYYTRLINLFAGLHGLPLSSFSGKGTRRQRTIYNFYDRYLINIDLIPYRSQSTSSLSTGSSAICYLNKRFDEVLDQVQCIRNKFNLIKVILNGKVFVDLIYRRRINSCSCKTCKVFSINILRTPRTYKNFTIYDVNINGIDVVIVDKFLTFVGKGCLTNTDLYSLGASL